MFSSSIEEKFNVYLYHLPIIQQVVTLQLQTTIWGPKVTKVAVPDIFSMFLVFTHNTSS